MQTRRTAVCVRKGTTDGCSAMIEIKPPKVLTKARHTGGESINRSRTGGASGGIEPRLTGTVCRAVQSDNCWESASDMLLSTDQQPIPDTVAF